MNTYHLTTTDGAVIDVEATSSEEALIIASAALAASEEY